MTNGDEAGASAVPRSFRWGDLEALLDARSAVAGSPTRDRAAALAELSGELEMPGADPEANVLVAEGDEGLSGCAVLHLEPAVGRAVGEFGVVPTARRGGLGRALLGGLLSRASEAGAGVLHVSAAANDGVLGGMLSRAGFRHVRTYDTMLRPEAEGGPRPRPLADGLSLRRYVPGEDEGTLARLQNAAFEGAWGFAPNTPEEIRSYVAMRSTRPEDILFAVDDGAGEPIGYIWTAVDRTPGQSSGMVAMTGVHPTARGRGIGTAIIGAGVRHVLDAGAVTVSLEVDGSNVPAISVYRALGFVKTGEILWYETNPGG